MDHATRQTIISRQITRLTKQGLLLTRLTNRHPPLGVRTSETNCHKACKRKRRCLLKHRLFIVPNTIVNLTQNKNTHAIRMSVNRGWFTFQ